MGKYRNSRAALAVMLTPVGFTFVPIFATMVPAAEVIATPVGVAWFETI
jgi:hypothetical protein